MGLPVEVSLSIFALAAPAAAHLTSAQGVSVTSVLVTVMLFVAAFLFVLNLALAIAFRKRRALEIITYVVASLIELAIFVFVLLLQLGILTHVPLNLPPGLPIDRAEMGGTIALAIGLFPAAYWHRTTMSQLRQRMADDAKVIKNREGGVRIRSNAPGEWLN
jgi:hypothetical protein